MKPGFQTRNRQSGMVLVLALLILFVLTLLGASAMSNSHVQERAAGNARLQAQAFEAAAAGAINAINFFEAQKDASFAFPDELCGARDHTGWGNANPTTWVSMGTVNGVNLKQRTYCLADAYPDDASARPARSELFVLSRGEVMSGSTVVATRDIEVRLDIGTDGGSGDGCGAICFPSCQLGDLAFPTSNAFEVNGNGGLAISSNANCPGEDTATELTDAIRDNRIGNYDGGIDATGIGEPWNDATKTDAFRTLLKDAAQAADLAVTCQGKCYNHPTLTPGIVTTTNQDGDVYMVDNGNTVHGTDADPQITYYDGNVSFSGTIEGSGIMVVTGDVSWNGTNAFHGLIIVLGGLYDITGGGTGGDHAGSLVLLNVEGQGTSPTFGSVDADFTGGGTAEYNFDCAALWRAYALTGYSVTYTDAGDPVADPNAPWAPNCATSPPNIFLAGPPEMIIASWRENIGWRELQFGSN